MLPQLWSGKFFPSEVLGDTYPSSGDTINFSAADVDSGVYDCNVSKSYVEAQSWHTSANKTNEEIELLNSVMVDYARLPSIREAALSGAMGLSLDPNEPVTGDYLAFLDNAYDVGDTFDQTYRGSPQLPGYFGFTLCSNRVNAFTGDAYSFNPNEQYYTPYDVDTQDAYRYTKYCSLVDSSDHFVAHLDDAGGPGNRVRVVLTYRHPMITPFLSTWWPTLRLTAEREGLVEKFRVSRITGLVGSIGNAPINTNTPLPTNTPTNTPTPTSTPAPCNMYGTGILGSYYLESNKPNYNSIPVLQRINSKINFDWGSNGPAPGIRDNNFAVQWVGKVIPPVPGDYIFSIRSDDGSRLFIDGVSVIPDSEFLESSQCTNF